MYKPQQIARWLKLTALGVGGLFLAWRLQQTLQILLISLFLAGAIAPLVEKMQAYKIKRGWALAIIYTVILLVLVLVIAPLPRLLEELGQFFAKLPDLINQIPIPDTAFWGVSRQQILELIQSGAILSQVQSIGRDIANQTLEITLRLVSAIGIGLVSLVITGYFVANSEVLLQRTLSLFPPVVTQQVNTLLPPITRCLSAYVLGRLGTSALLGFCCYLVLTIAQVPYGAALGFLLAVTNLVPFVGAFVGLILIVIASWNLGAPKVITVVSICFILQQIEAWILQPLLVGPYLNLSPFELLMSVIIGTELLGVVGSIIAPPIAAIGRIIFHHFWAKPDTPPDS